MFSFKVQYGDQELTLQTPGYFHAGVLHAQPWLPHLVYDPFLTCAHGTFYVRDSQGYRIILNIHQAMMYLFWLNLIYIDYRGSLERCGKFHYMGDDDCVRFGAWCIAFNRILYKSKHITPIDNFTLHKRSTVVRTAHTRWYMLTFIALTMAINGAHVEY